MLIAAKSYLFTTRLIPHVSWAQKVAHGIVPSRASSWDARCFKALDVQGRGFVFPDEIIRPILVQGVEHHATLKPLVSALQAKDSLHRIYFEEFKRAEGDLSPLSSGYFKRVVEADLIIPMFSKFRRKFYSTHDEVKADSAQKYSHGTCADYIPTLAAANPELLSNTFCSADAQFCSVGDTSMTFSIQSICKIVTYAFIHDLIGDEIHRWVNCEPSGHAFNANVFDTQGRPHNPMVNAGAIVVCSVILSRGKGLNDVLAFWKKASNASIVNVDEALYLEEKATGFTNHGLTSFTIARKNFPPVGPDVHNYASSARK